MSNFNFPNLQRIVSLWRRGRERSAKMRASAAPISRPAQRLVAQPPTKEPS